MNEETRNAFEAWYLKEHPHENIPGIFARQKSSDAYVQFLPQLSFQAWRAASALKDQEISKLKEEIESLAADIYKLRNQ